MMAEERDEQEKSVGEALDEWREAERDAGTEDPGSAAGRMARKRADHARDEFHDIEDEEHHHHGDDRPRHGET